MAGIIEFPNADWDVSSGGFRSMAAGVVECLADTPDASKVRDVLEMAVKSQLYFVNIQKEFTAEMLREFGAAVHKHYDAMASLDPSTTLYPELHPGIVKKLDELRGLLNSMEIC